MITLLSCAVVSAAEEKDGDAFVKFRPTVAMPFGVFETQALADAQRVALYGLCGMSIFKEKKGPFWIFETEVGYSCTHEPAITVVEPPVPLPCFSVKKETPTSR